jgi:hypothetical protein
VESAASSLLPRPSARRQTAIFFSPAETLLESTAAGGAPRPRQFGSADGQGGPFSGGLSPGDMTFLAGGLTLGF